MQSSSDCVNIWQMLVANCGSQTDRRFLRTTRVSRHKERLIILDVRFPPHSKHSASPIQRKAEYHLETVCTVHFAYIYEIDQTMHNMYIYMCIYIYIQGDSLARGPKQIWEKYSRIWRNAFKCAWMWKQTSFSIDYEQVLFCIVPGMYI